MAFHPVPLTSEVVMRGDHEGDPRVTVLHYRRSPLAPVPSVADLQTLCAHARDNVLFYLAACCVPTTRWNEVTATNIDTEDGNRYTMALDPVFVGARGGDELPGNVNVALAKKTTSHTAGGRGRLFVPDITESDQDDAFIGNALTSLLLGLAARLLTNAIVGAAPTTYNMVPVVASKKHSTSANITGVTFDNVTDSLRTRLRGHRRRRRRVVPV